MSGISAITNANQPTGGHLDDLRVSHRSQEIITSFELKLQKEGQHRTYHLLLRLLLLGSPFHSCLDKPRQSLLFTAGILGRSFPGHLLLVTIVLQSLGRLLLAPLLLLLG